MFELKKKCIHTFEIKDAFCDAGWADELDDGRLTNRSVPQVKPQINFEADQSGQLTLLFNEHLIIVRNQIYT